MSNPLKILMIEDSEDDALLVLSALKKGGFAPESLRVETAAQMREALRQESWDVILSDFKLARFSGLEAIALLRETRLDIPILIVSGSIGEEMAVECMRKGASDYVMKGNLSRLVPAILRGLDEATSRARRREVENALQISEEKFRTIANYTVDWESWFGPDGKYLWVNPGVKRLTGYSAAEILAMPDFVSVMFAEEDRETFRRYFKDALTSAQGDNYEIRYLHKDGSMKWLSVSWQPVYGVQGEFLGIRTSGRDINNAKKEEGQRRDLEKQLFQAQKMEAIGTLAGGIAHDFNNILSGIIGYAELAAMQADESIRQRNMKQILNAAERARNLIKQIMAFSRHVEPDKKPMDFRMAISDALKLLRATIPASIDIDLSLTKDPAMISADYTQMHQVIMNICTNAVHAMGEKGGTLGVTLSCDEIRAGLVSDQLDLAPGVYGKLSISDTGCGIDPAHMRRLFDPFFTTKEAGEGTGLGLAVVYGIVRDHGGNVGVSSQLGRGSRFDVYIPLLEHAGLKDEQARSAEIPCGTESILFADDEEDLTEIWNVMLGSLGYRVTACTDGLQALNTFRANPASFDLVITDMNMPSLSGADLVKQILKTKPDQPILLCTGYSDYMDAEKAANMGIRGFALKPLTKKVLAQMIRQALVPKPE